MADYLSNLENVSTLFSVSGRSGKSYFHQVLGNDAVPEAASVYQFGLDEMEAKLDEAAERFDDFVGRKNRVLDYLLALYGEEFSQNSLRHHLNEESHADVEIMQNKLVFLKDVLDIGRRRASAFDYRKEVGGRNVSGLQRKLCILLGLTAAESRFHLVEHVLLRPSDGASEDVIPGDFYSFRISLVFPAEVERYANPEFRKLVEETLGLNCPVHILPQVLWLDSSRMEVFETRQRVWLDARCRSLFADANAESAARTLALFLKEAGEGVDV